MKMNRIIALLLAVLFASLAACSPKPPADATPAPTGEVMTPDCAEPTIEPTAEPTSAPTETPTEAPTEAPTEEPTPELPARFVFQPKVTNVYQKEVFGQTMIDAWYNFVDAVMAGETTFACPDKDTYNWVMGQFRDPCFPLLYEITDYAYDRDNPVKDGVGSFTYTIPEEEVPKRIEEFIALVEGILNETMRTDYSDFEKCAALYKYFADNYTYDYDMFDRNQQGYVFEACAMRCFREGKGICAELSAAYSYLLMQAGVEASVMSGNRVSDSLGHQWSYVRINGKNYHIDPTFALDSFGSLSYLMMTDARREVMDDFPVSTLYAVSHYSKEHPHPDYEASDDFFAPIWDYQFEALYPDEDILRCWCYSEGWEKEYFDFDYSGF